MSVISNLSKDVEWKGNFFLPNEIIGILSTAQHEFNTSKQTFAFLIKNY